MNTVIDTMVLKNAAAHVREAFPAAKPLCALVLGSGWAKTLDDFYILQEIEYSQIPGMGRTDVLGHIGKLSWAKMNETEVLIFQGRRHWYEGEGWTPVIMPSFIAKQLGCKYLLLTNASGGIHKNCKPGTLVAISDHINMLGANPLQGPHRPELGDRFPDMSEIYRSDLRKKLLDAGADMEGVYVVAMGPSYETPAEIKSFEILGADIVGMSTAPEAIVANALGLRVAALSCVSNWGAGIGKEPLTGEDIIKTAKKNLPKMKSVILKFIENLPER